MAKVINCITSREAWLALKDSFSNSSKHRELQLKDELQLMQRGSRGVAEYAHSFRSLCDQLGAIGKSFGDTDKVHWFLRGLRSDFKIFSTLMLSQVPLSTFANLVPKALSHELFSRSISGDSGTHSAMVVQRTHHTSKSKSGSSPVNVGSSSNVTPITCQWCGKERHTAKKYHKLGKLLKKAKSDGLIEALAATSLGESGETEWYTDTGAIVHMTNDSANLDNSIPYTGSNNKNGCGSQAM
ncbi:hypothetical protein Dimus_038311 [Dionaea muscipula]